MEEVGRDESTVSTIEVFLCYAHKDEEYRQRLEKHLAIFQREGLICLWHDGDISPGKEWEQIIYAHLHMAQIVLLLVSPDFMASKYCYSVEMKKALERHTRGETRIIPVIARPIRWEKGPFGKLQALPKNAKPIALWRYRDEAFLDVAEGIRRVIEEIQTQPISVPLSNQQRELGGKHLQNLDLSEQQPMPEELLGKYEATQKMTDSPFPEDVSPALIYSPAKVAGSKKRLIDKNIPLFKNGHLDKRRLLVSVVFLLALVLSLVPIISFSTCFATFCNSVRQSPKQPSPQKPYLSATVRDVLSPSFVFPDAPSHYIDGNIPPTSISAVLLPKNAASYCTIIVDVQALRFGGAYIFIDDIALKLLSIPGTWQPLRVWTSGVSTPYNTYPYPVTYRGQSLEQLQDHLLYATPPGNVTLQPAEPGRPAESNQLSIQVMSTVTVRLQFQVQIIYQLANINTRYTLTLPRTFQVVFSDTSNWQEYILQNGSLVKKS